MIRPFSSSGSTRLRIAACLASLLLLFSLLGSAPAAAQDETDEVVIFVLDLSGSMNEPFDGAQSKLDVAKAAFVEAFANVSPDAQVGLRIYGDQIEPTTPEEREASCTTDTRIAAPPAPQQREKLIGQVQGFTALGDTPMGLALRAAESDIPAGATGTIVLFSDGRDECFDADLDGDPTSGPSFGEEPCAVAQDITADDSAVDRVVTVGFRADAAAEVELRCIADATGGSYTSIQSPEDARNALPELLVQLSAPREAQRLLGQDIQGTSDANDDTPDFLRLDDAGVDQVLYTDTIDMNSERVYRFESYGPEAGTVTGTVFGLPAEEGITFDIAVVVPSLNRTFFRGEHADENAGLPARQTASIRCTECEISGGPYEVFWVLSLRSENSEISGTYELEILTEGPGFGGKTTSCAAPQACFYPQEIITLTERLEEATGLLQGGTDGLASQELLDEREALRLQTAMDQNEIAASDARSTELEELIAAAPAKSNSYTLPLLMIVGGGLLAFAPVEKLRRKPKEDDERGEADGTLEAESIPVAPAPPSGERTGPSLDVGPAPAISPNRKGSGNNWDAELEAAKVALAEQRPERPAPPGPDEPAKPRPPEPAPPAATQAPAAPQPSDGFTPEQHAAAKAAAEKIAAEQAAAAAPVAAGDPMPAPPPMPAAPIALGAPTSDADRAAEQAAAEQAAQQQAAQQQAAQQQAAQQQAAQQQAAQAQAAEQAAQQQKAAQAAAEQAAQQQAAQQAAEQAAEAEAEAKRQEARSRMLAKQNIVSTSSATKDNQPVTTAASEGISGSTGAITGEPSATTAATPAPAAQPSTQQAPGWYVDPTVADQYRWWDGQSWTEHTSKPEGAS